ncbi:uncharacterized protein VTP21DRAFT_7269 [Calcarisporiella thermophila]|uniref:uncharacterized protein n=1 Tax=Calcarisporiella thermophila TaxID=911321 RepID=UPI003743BEBC
MDSSYTRQGRRHWFMRVDQAFYPPSPPGYFPHHHHSLPPYPTPPFFVPGAPPPPPPLAAHPADPLHHHHSIHPPIPSGAIILGEMPADENGALTEARLESLPDDEEESKELAEKVEEENVQERFASEIKRRPSLFTVKSSPEIGLRASSLERETQAVEKELHRLLSERGIGLRELEEKFPPLAASRRRRSLSPETKTKSSRVHMRRDHSSEDLNRSHHYRDALAAREEELRALRDMYNTKEKRNRQQATVIKLYRQLLSKKNEELENLGQHVENLSWRLERLRRVFTRERDRLVVALKEHEDVIVKAIWEEVYPFGMSSEEEPHSQKRKDTQTAKPSGDRPSDPTAQNGTAKHGDVNRPELLEKKSGGNVPLDPKPATSESIGGHKEFSGADVNPEFQMARQELLALTDLLTLTSVPSTAASSPVKSTQETGNIDGDNIPNDMLIVKARDKIMTLAAQVERLQSTVHEMTTHAGRQLVDASPPIPKGSPTAQGLLETSLLAPLPPDFLEETYAPPAVFARLHDSQVELPGHPKWESTYPPALKVNGQPASPVYAPSTPTLPFGELTWDQKLFWIGTILFLFVINAGFLRAWGVLEP